MTAATTAAPWRGLAALGFVAVSLIALVAVPPIYERPVAAIQERIDGVLDPATRDAVQLSLLLSRQMARMEGFILTGDRPTFRQPYVAGITVKDSVLQELRGLALRLEADVGEEVFDRVSALYLEWTDWDLQNSTILDPAPSEDEEPTAAVRAAQLARVRSGHASLQRSIEVLERTIDAAVASAEASMSDARTFQNRLTFGLAIVALFGTVIVGRIGYRYRALTLEREARRREAVRARREIDALLEATGDGVLGVDLDGKCTSLNRAGARLLGYTEGEIRGRDVHLTLFHSRADGTPVPREVSPVLRSVADGRPMDSGDDDVLWRRKRVPFPARWSLRPLVDGVDLRGGVLTFTDMTEIREKEEALQRAVESREDVVSIVSHDLRNPLGVVLAAADLLLDLPLDEQQRRRQAEIISRSGRRMQRLIEDLLDVARIEAGALVVRPSLEVLVPILEEARDLFLDQAEEKGIDIVVRSGPGELSARVDRDRLLQALSNLLDNALRFTPEGGRIVLAVDDAGPDVTISVADSGTGIEPAMQESLFDRFAQTQKSGRGGAGLGLAIVDGVASAHGGGVAVTSTPAEGSRFDLTLPKAGPALGGETAQLRV